VASECRGPPRSTIRSPLPKGRILETLKDAAVFITKLPKAEHDTPEWQAAMEALILIAETGGDPDDRR
jgi:hypothetical protein